MCYILALDLLFIQLFCSIQWTFEAGGIILPSNSIEFLYTQDLDDDGAQVFSGAFLLSYLSWGGLITGYIRLSFKRQI